MREQVLDHKRLNRSGQNARTAQRLCDEGALDGVAGHGGCSGLDLKVSGVQILKALIGFLSHDHLANGAGLGGSDVNKLVGFLL